MKHLLYIFIFTTICSFLLNSCLNDPDMRDGVINGKEPVVDSLKITEITANSMNLSAELIKENGSPAIEYGFVVRNEEGLDTILSAEIKKETRKFHTTISDLEKNKKYIIKAFARNTIGESYSKSDTVYTTDGIGEVVTLQPDTVRGSSAILKAVIKTHGEAEVLTRGFFISKRENMLDRDTIIVNIQTDTFTYKKTGLDTLTTYYVKAFAENKFGLFRNESIKSFKTTNGKAKVSIPEVIDKEYKYVIIKADVLDEGDASVTMRGICWGTTENPTIMDNKVERGTGAGEFEAKIEPLVTQVQYYARTYAINTFGVSYSNEQISFVPKRDQPTVKTYAVSNPYNGSVVVKGEVIDQGPSVVIASGICWSATTTPSIYGDHIQLSSGINAFEGEVKNLIGDTKYKFRAYATNNNETVYGEIVTFETPPIFSEAASFTGGTRIPNSSAYFSVGSTGYLLGGDLGPQCTNQLWSYNSEENKWQELLAFPGGKYKWQAAIGEGNFGYIFGGSDNTSLTNKVYRYSTYQNDWTELKTNTGPAPFHSTSVASVNGEIYLIGGCRDTVTNEVWHFSNSNWEKKANLEKPQYKCIAISIGNRLYAGLGTLNLDGHTTNILWSLSGDMNTWKEETTMPGGGKARGGIGYNGEIYVVDDTGTIRKYIPSTKEWKTKSKLQTRNKSIHCMYNLNGSIYIGLGDNSSELIKYNPLWDNKVQNE